MMPRPTWSAVALPFACWLFSVLCVFGGTVLLCVAIVAASPVLLVAWLLTAGGDR